MLHLGMNMPLHLMALYGSVAILVVFLLRLLLKNRLPKFLFPALWGLVLFRLLVPFSISTPLSAPVPSWWAMDVVTETVYVSSGDALYMSGDVAESETPQGLQATYTYAESAAPSPFAPIPPVFLLYGAGAAATVAVLVWQHRRYKQRLSNSLLLEHNETVNAALDELALGRVLVRTNDEISSPLVCGLRNPCIYLPTDMDFGNKAMVRHILLHEAMHVRRCDNWVKAVMLVALCLHWYNPLVWLMAGWLSADLEAACDAAVLRHTGAEEKKSYAESLLSMAVPGGRGALLYSAFSKTEVERRLKGVLGYKAATALMVLLCALVLLGGTVVFAAAGQAPFSEYLSSFCARGDNRWGMRATLARDISVGVNAQQRADRALMGVLADNATEDPGLLTAAARTALAEEFGVERAAFRIDMKLVLTEEERLQEYAEFGITKGEDGHYLYQGESVRIYTDLVLGSVQTRSAGTVDISVVRDWHGRVSGVTATHAGDAEFDRRTRDRELEGAYTVSAVGGAMRGASVEIAQAVAAEQVSS